MVISWCDGSSFAGNGGLLHGANRVDDRASEAREPGAFFLRSYYDRINQERNQEGNQEASQVRVPDKRSRSDQDETQVHEAR